MAAIKRNRVFRDRRCVVKGSIGIAIVPHHVIALITGYNCAILDIRGLIPIAGTVILETVENNACDICRNFCRVDVMGTIIFNESHYYAGPGAFTIAPVMDTDIRPLPVILEVNSLCAFHREDGCRHHGQQHCHYHNQAQHT